MSTEFPGSELMWDPDSYPYKYISDPKTQWEYRFAKANNNKVVYKPILADVHKVMCWTRPMQKASDYVFIPAWIIAGAVIVHAVWWLLSLV